MIDRWLTPTGTNRACSKNGATKHKRLHKALEEMGRIRIISGVKGVDFRLLCRTRGGRALDGLQGGGSTVAAKPAPPGSRHAWRLRRLALDLLLDGGQLQQHLPVSLHENQLSAAGRALQPEHQRHLEGPGVEL